MNHQKLLALLRENKTDKAFARLYKHFPAVKKLVTKHGGSKQDAQDVFQEALIVLYRKVQDPAFELTASPGTYLYSVSRNLWKKQTTSTLALKETEDTTDLDEEIEKERKLQAIEQVISTLSKQCQSIFKYFYFEKLSMELIAQKMNYSSSKVAKTKKYKCLEQAKKKITL